MNKFEETGSVTDILRQVQHPNIRSAENTAIAAQSVEQETNMSSRYSTFKIILGLIVANFVFGLMPPFL